MPFMVRADYNQLQAGQKLFTAEAAAIEAVLRRLDNAMQDMRNGGWEGKGSDAFFSVMDGRLLPAVQRLIVALQQTTQTISEITYGLSHADGDAAQRFKYE